MSNLDIFLDHWMIRRNDGTTILNGNSDDFAKGLKEIVALEKIELLREVIQAELPNLHNEDD